MNVYLFGQRNLTGGGKHFAGMADAMSKLSELSHNLNEINVEGKKVHPIVSSIRAEDVSIFFFPTISEQFVRGFIIKWAIFEANKLSDDYLSYLDRSHLIWAPSTWAADILKASGLDNEKIHIVPEGVDPNIYNPFGRAFRGDDPVFRFLMCGKFEARKGHSELLDGFKLAFGQHQNVELHLKADYFWGSEEQVQLKKNELIEQIETLGLKNVRPIFGAISEQQLSFLYKHADAFVFPSRAEGWGLPLIEAIACGSPVASTFYSGHTEYLTQIRDKITELSHNMMPIECPEFISFWGERGDWAVVEPNQIAEKLLELKKNILSKNKLALEASHFVRNNFSWRHAAERALLSLQSLGFCRYKNCYTETLGNPSRQFGSGASK